VCARMADSGRSVVAYDSVNLGYRAYL
jgi:hypothetical protein